MLIIYRGKYGLPTNNNRPGLCLAVTDWSKRAVVQNRTTFIMFMNIISHIEYQNFATFSNGLLSFFMYVLRFLCETVPKFICEILHTSYLRISFLL